MRALSVLILLLWGALVSSSRAAPPDADPAAVLQALDARANSVTSLRYGVLRTTVRGGTRSEERWRFVWEQAPGQAFPKLRIDYDGDTQRVIVSDGATLTDYVPALRKAMRYSLAELPTARAQELLKAILDKVAVPGFRSGYDPRMRWTWEQDSSGAYEIVGRDSSSGELRFLLRDDRAALLRSEIRRGGVFALSVKASEHQEILPGVWFPRRLELRMPAEAGVGEVSLRVSNLSCAPSPASLFELRLDPSVELVAGR